MFRIIETTTDSITVAEMISQSIINSKLSPCVQILDVVKSNYIWKNEIESSKKKIYFKKGFELLFKTWQFFRRTSKY